MKLFMGFSWKIPHENFKIHGLQIHENAMKFVDHENSMKLQCWWAMHENSMKSPGKIHVKPMKSLKIFMIQKL